MLSLYVHGVSWDLTRKEPTQRRGAGVGHWVQIVEPSYQAYSTPFIAGLEVSRLVGRPLARIRGGEEGRDSKEGRELVMGVSLVL